MEILHCPIMLLPYIGDSSLSYSRRSVSGPLWAFAAAGCIARTTGIAGVCFTAFGLMGFSG